MLAEIEIKRAYQSELPLIRNLLEENKLPFRDIDTHIQFFIIRQGDMINTCIGLEFFRPCVLLRSLAVSDSVKKQGLGSRLTLFILDYLTVNGISGVYLLTTTAENFFSKIGFQPISREIVPAAIQKSTEFSTLCPESAVCMYYELFS